MKVWDTLHFQMAVGLHKSPWLIGKEVFLAHVQIGVMLNVLCNIWKSRNTLIFNSENDGVITTLKNIVRDLGFWACRICGAKCQIVAWQVYIQGCLSRSI